MGKNDFFAIDARTIFQLGKEAIENELLAISELVKNAYDADASECTVDFMMYKKRNEENTASAHTIYIKDTGHGMSLDDLKKNWLRIGTMNKLNDKFTPKGRRKIGEKGIGRLALNRLGNLVNIYSHKKGSQPVRLTINFEKFKNGLNLGEIPIYLEELPVDNPKISNDYFGTIIEIKELLDSWNEDKIIELENKTITLQNPFANIRMDKDNKIVIENENEIKIKNTDIKINIFINSKPFNSETTEIIECLRHSLFRAHIIADSSNNTWKYNFSFHPYSKMTKVAADNKKIDEFLPIKIKGDNKIINIEPDTINFGKIEITVFAYDFSSLVNKLSPFSTIRNIKRIVKELGGIKVFRDNQRVYNYGEIGTDWLDLDIRRLNNPSKFLSNNVLFGNVTLDRDDSTGLKEKTNREGFIDDDYFKKFKKIVQSAIDDFSSEVGMYKDRIKKMYQGTNKRVRADEIFDDLIDTIELSFIDEIIKENIKGYVILYKEQMDYIKNVLFNVSINAMDYITIFHDLESKLIQLKERVSLIKNDQRISRQFAEIITFVKGHNDMIRDKDRRKYKINNMLDDLLFEESFYLERNKVDLQTNFSATEKKVFIFHQPSVKRVLNNIITNSVYWTSANERSIISIKTEIERNYLVIIIDDNGPGFDGDIEYLKEPFVTRKKGNMGLGLGMFIIDELMQKQRGYVEFSNDSEIENGGARVKIFFENEKDEVETI